MIQRLSDFDYSLPEELIAQEPAPRRGSSRLLILGRGDAGLRHDFFRALPRYLKPGDLLVLNDTKVMPARLMGRRKTGGSVEVFLLGPDASSGRGRDVFRAMIRPLGRLKTGEVLFFEKGFSCVLVDPVKKLVAFEGGEARAAMAATGQIPLPPYIRRAPSARDVRRYQTVYARNEGAVAAPTAGLHFTQALLRRLKTRGISIATLTLHVNYATFAPVRVDDIRDHRMEPEVFEIPAQTLRALRRVKRHGGRVVAIGTTVAKALEDAAGEILSEDPPARVARESRLFIAPPYAFRVVDALVTNFHLPRTTLLMLVSAFAGRERVLSAYKEAVRAKYRFFSYGDAMLIA